MNDAKKPPAPFTPLAQNSFDGIALARSLLRSISTASLATLSKGAGYPFATLTSVATMPDGAPILLVSELAHHTRNLRGDCRASLLLAQGGKGDPMAHPRLTLVGKLEAITDPVARERFLRRNPKAALYADFPDFSFWRLIPEAGHLNGGFARAADYAGADLLCDVSQADELIAAEARLLDEINAEPRAYLSTLASAAGEDHKKPWRATGLDPEGLDLQAPQENARLVFARQAPDPRKWREALAETLRQNAGTGGD